MNYYEEIIAKINSLIEAGEFDEAEKLVSIELQMPYIPEQYEKQLDELSKKQHWLTQNDNNLKTLTIDDVKRELLSDNNDSIIFLIEQIENYNLNKLTQEFEYFLKNSKISTFNKTLMLFKISQLALNYEFKVITNEQDYTVNPSEIIVEKHDNYLNEVVNFIENNVAGINPSMTEIMTSITFTTYFYCFPSRIVDDIRIYGSAIISIVEDMFESEQKIILVNQEIESTKKFLLQVLEEIENYENN